MKLAAIDIGSNAARLLISEVILSSNRRPQFQKVNLVRVPLRLGFDVFDQGKISEEKEDMILNTIKAYKLLIDAYGVKHCKAAATSAMRHASNAIAILERVKKETGIPIEVITGDAEASLIYENHIAENLDKNHTYLYIDVGGGSTELTFFANGRLIFKRSFDIGTIRLLKNQVDDYLWSEMKDFVKRETKPYHDIMAIGSGGNINKIFSLSKRKEGKSLPLQLLKDYYKEFSSFSVADRIRIYKLREDRADVIVPALFIYVNVMRWAGIEEIYVPKIGLADGLIQHLYDELKEKGKVIFS
ncbi:exopolyphosphatase [Niastella yeongjuensis]|uniref:Exopolyphosphatase n=1 Tax=Niastella yeongjuensis TaxID=354355 RepID=A0A1V9EFK3_9BACT|nr:exopolyphosphatase [Niastella yeongjuensis]OQP44705.1 exopolyphosphatase [Niastella yeongjuensis]SEO78121.1 exopolyphosphatase / guanosine-5'-triphosphate,3'-diphosphate pyrophosphatase [Niastella yeongjuensis]